MIGEYENSLCPTCGGPLQKQVSAIPFLLKQNAIVVVKGVPAEVCADCHEPFLAGQAVDRVSEILRQLRILSSEVSVIAYPEAVVA
ncbi:MAG: YgiT-type zinc finger protein [Caldilineaceae bacterium]|nr:YgiT-type zinc finger protein [Caldilineaceae bacterium]HRJ43800.1 YgiT-type zinc finger protein [Caldilineaceae bacterium]